MMIIIRFVSDGHQAHAQNIKRPFLSIFYIYRHTCIFCTFMSHQLWTNEDTDQGQC